MNLTAHMSDIHQNETYVDVLENILPETRLLVLHGDILQCHKNKRPSKGRVKGLPKVDNGNGEGVQKWVLEAAAYINYGTPVPKGEPVDFETIPSGVLRINTENYEAMHRFMEEVANDTLFRMETIAEITEKRYRETGMETVLLAGHDNAYELWMDLLFPDIPSVGKIYNGIAQIAKGFRYVGGKPSYKAFTDGEDTTQKMREGNAETPDVIEMFVPLVPLEETVHLLKAYIGKDNGDVFDTDLVRYCGAVGHDFGVDERSKVIREVASRCYDSDAPQIYIDSHEGPKEISEIVNNGKGKATENDTDFRALFDAFGERICASWIYGNDGEPKAVSKTILHLTGFGNSVLVKVHHLAEMDEKKNPMSTRGGVTYFDHKTGAMIGPMR